MFFTDVNIVVQEQVLKSFEYRENDFNLLIVLDKKKNFTAHKNILSISSSYLR